MSSDIAQLLEIVKSLKQSSEANIRSNIAHMQGAAAQQLAQAGELHEIKTSIDGINGKLIHLTGLDGQPGAVSDLKTRVKGLEVIVPSKDKVEGIELGIAQNMRIAAKDREEIESLKQWRMYISGALVALGVVLGVVLKVAKF